jgi:type II secretory pathway component PulJ
MATQNIDLNTEEESKRDNSEANKASENNPQSQPASEKKKVGEKDTPKEYSVSEIFSMMNAKTQFVQKIREEISELDKKIISNSALIEELTNKIRPVSRIRSKYKLNGTIKEKLPLQDRKGIKLEVKVLENQTLILEDQKERLTVTLKKRAGEVESDLKNDELIQKAKSLKWTKRNKWSIKEKILKTLNTGLKTEKQTLLTLQSYANSKRETADEDFSKLLSEFLDRTDSETFILCSHELRKEMYDIIKLTIKKWNPKRDSEISELEIPSK